MIAQIYEKSPLSEKAMCLVSFPHFTDEHPWTRMLSTELLLSSRYGWIQLHEKSLNCSCAGGKSIKEKYSNPLTFGTHLKVRVMYVWD